MSNLLKLTYGLHQNPGTREDDTIDLLDDFDDLDAEILDYGISENELEENSASPKEISSSNSPIEYSVKCSKSVKPSFVSVKLVDCVKYPWYYVKYKEQILKRKYFDAINNARIIIDTIKNDMNNPPIAIDLNHSNVSSEIISDDSYYTMKLQQTSAVVCKPIQVEDKIKMSQETQNNLSGNEKTVPNNQIGFTMVDIKKNQGLVGMKIQRITQGDKRYCVKKKNIKRKVEKHTKKKFENSFNTNAINKPQPQNISDLKKDPIIKDFKKTDEPRCEGLRCSLDLDSQKILMKIKKIESSKNKVTKNNLKDPKDLNALKGKNSRDIVEKNNVLQNSSNDNKKVVKYKPMPKSKRLALEQSSKDNEIMKRYNDLFNNQIEQPKPIPKSTVHLGHGLNSCYKINKTDKVMRTTFLKQKNKQSKPVVNENKMKQRVKILKITPSFEEKMSKLVDTMNNDTNKVLVQPIINMSVEPLKPLFPKIVQNMTCKNKIETSFVSSDFFDSKQNIDKYNVTYPNSYNIEIDWHDGSMLSKEKNNNNTPTVHSTKNCQDRDVLPVPTTAVTTTSFTKFNSEISYINQRQNAETSSIQSKCKKSLNPSEDSTKCNFQPINSFTHINTSPFDKYIVPDPANAQGLTNYYSETIQSEKIKENTTEKNKYTKTIFQITQPNQVLVQTALQNSANNNSRGYNKKVERADTVPNVHQNHVPKDWPASICIVPHMTPAQTTNTTIPSFSKTLENNSKPLHRAGFERPLSHPNNRFRLRTPAAAPLGQMPYVFRPPLHSTQVPHWTHNQYQPAPYGYPPPRGNFQHIPWNRLERPHYTQSTYIQHNNNLHFNSLHYPQTPPNAHMPPGLCNMTVNNGNWQYESLYHRNLPQPQYPHPPPKLPPPPPYPYPPSTLTNTDKSTIIGENFSGPITKINIPKSDPSILANEESKKNIVKTEKIDTNLNETNMFSNNSEDETRLALTKAEMMTELEKVMRAVNSLEAKKPVKKGVSSERKMVTGFMENKLNYVFDPPRNVVSGYSPPVLPIQTFEEILQHQNRVSNTKVPLHNITPSHTMNVINYPQINQNIPIAKPKRMRRKSAPPQKYNAKKISLDEYKGRTVNT